MIEVQIGDSRQLIHSLSNESIDCVVTSPPYWNLRDYRTEPLVWDGLPACDHEWEKELMLRRHEKGETNPGKEAWYKEDEAISDHAGAFCNKCGAWKGQLGLEPSHELFIKHLLDVFDLIRPVLKNTGSVFVNLGDTYSNSGSNSQPTHTSFGKLTQSGYKTKGHRASGLPPKCLCLIPQRFAWGMIEHGWILRNEIIWAKPNHMPESVADRLTKAHEVIYHFVKQEKYYYDLDAIREPHLGGNKDKRALDGKRHFSKGKSLNNQYSTNNVHYNLKGKNPGDVWSITTQLYPESHFAVFPLELVRRPILAGCPPNGIVLDPFAGSGTVGEFCRHNDRNAILFELNPEYKKLIEDRAMLLVPELSEWCSTIEDADG